MTERKARSSAEPPSSVVGPGPPTRVSSDDLGPPWRITPGAHSVQMRIDPNYLRPGLYTLSLAIDSAHPQDYLEDAVEFEVMATSPHTNKHTNGYFQLPLVWMFCRR